MNDDTAEQLERIAQLAENPATEQEWVCRGCGDLIAAAAGFVIPEVFVNTAKTAR